MNLYVDENGIEKLKCPICGRDGFVRLKSHIVQKHKGVEISEDTVLLTNDARHAQSQRTKELWTRQEWRDDVIPKISKSVIKQWERDYDRMKESSSKTLANYRKTDKYKKEKSRHMKMLNEKGIPNRNGNPESLKKLWADPEWRAAKSKRTSELMKKRAEEGLINPRPYYGYTKYKNYKMRSKWEVRVAKQFDEADIEYEYESFCIKYSSDRIYRPDFYLPEFHLIVEVHPKALIDQVMLDKQSGCLENGYNFIFITNPDNVVSQIKDYATTIESLSDN